LEGITSAKGSPLLPSSRKHAKSRRGWILNGFLALALVGAVAAAVLAVDDPSKATATVRTATVSTGTVTATVSASGNLAASNSVGVDFSGSGGRVTGIFVREGDRVHKGQALAKIKDTPARRALASANASLKSAEGQYASATQGSTSAEVAHDQASIRTAEVAVANARTDVQHAEATQALDRQQQDALVAEARQVYQNVTDPTAKAAALATLQQAERTRQSTLLRDKQAIQDAEGQVVTAQAGVDSAKAAAAVNQQPASSGTVTSAQAQVSAAQVQVDEARAELRQTVLRAPVEGTVTSISGKVGEDSSSGASSSTTASGTSSSTTASGFVVIQGLTRFQITSMVAEADASKVHIDDPATVTFSALGETARGRVTSVAIQDTVSNNVVEYGVTVTLSGKPQGVQLGQTASVSVITEVARTVLTVPTSAVTTVGNLSTVTVRVNGVNSVRPVNIGLVGDTTTEVTSGLTEGEVVVLPSGSAIPSGFTFPPGGPPGLGGGLSG
jgi:HlyD family secretion protein